jgi:hypothetical protein
MIAERRPGGDSATRAFGTGMHRTADHGHMEWDRSVLALFVLSAAMRRACLAS